VAGQPTSKRQAQKDGNSTNTNGTGRRTNASASGATNGDTNSSKAQYSDDDSVAPSDSGKLPADSNAKKGAKKRNRQAPALVQQPTAAYELQPSANEAQPSAPSATTTPTRLRKVAGATRQPLLSTTTSTRLRKPKPIQMVDFLTGDQLKNVDYEDVPKRANSGVPAASPESTQKAKAARKSTSPRRSASADTHLPSDDDQPVVPSPRPSDAAAVTISEVPLESELDVALVEFLEPNHDHNGTLAADRFVADSSDACADESADRSPTSTSTTSASTSAQVVASGYIPGTVPYDAISSSPHAATSTSDGDGPRPTESAAL
jgi:hypothetical protein